MIPIQQWKKANRRFKLLNGLVIHRCPQLSIPLPCVFSSHAFFEYKIALIPLSQVVSAPGSFN